MTAAQLLVGNFEPLIMGGPLIMDLHHSSQDAFLSSP